MDEALAAARGLTGRDARLSVAAAILGGAYTAFRPPAAKATGIVQHFAAGVVFPAAAAGILLDVVHANAPVFTLVGALVMVGLQPGALSGQSVGSKQVRGRLGRGVPEGRRLAEGLLRRRAGRRSIHSLWKTPCGKRG